MRDKSVYFRLPVLLALLVFSFPANRCFAVSSKITRHSSKADLSKGDVNDVVIGSRGTIELASAAEMLAEELEDSWSINSIVTSGGTVYIGTSPNGGVYKYSLGKLTKIYPLPAETEKRKQDANEPNEPNAVEPERHLANEHIFAMSTDMAGRLLVGMSGDKCALYRLEAGKMEMVFVPGTLHEEPNDSGQTRYIFAIATDKKGNIYLATGPQGRVYKLDPSARGSELIYDSSDKNILSLAIGRDGFVYAGSDQRGLVYKINPDIKTATVLYDSDQPEITALVFGEDGQLYAAATSAKIAQAEAKLPPQTPATGRPELQLESRETVPGSDGGLKLKIANTKRKNNDDKSSQKQPPAIKKIKPSEASYIYKITGDGYVTDIFSESAVFFCLAQQDKNLLVGTGNSARLFTVEPTSEQQAVIYQDRQASQITAVTVSGLDVYIGTANPAKLIKLSGCFSAEGVYTSALIDAGQPAKWGKLQIEADIPDDCKILAASRSGNVKDINDSTFSEWTELRALTEPIQLRCPVGRFCQYKLVLQSDDGCKTPIVREITVASTVPNLAPKVESVSINRAEAADKTGVFKISYKAKDDNSDELIYKIDFRKIGRTNWLELKDKLEADSFEWNGRTVEDGRYEIRITASDERNNTTTTKLTGSRISEPVVVDNTAPVIKNASVVNETTTVVLKLYVCDQLSAIGQVHYTVDSNAEWTAAVPDDLVYDTTNENFTIVVEDLKAGEHIISIKAADDIGNTMYKTFEVNLN